MADPVRRGFVSPHCRARSFLQGFSPAASGAGSSPALALLMFHIRRRSPSGLGSSCWSVAAGAGLARRSLDSLLVFTFLGSVSAHLGSASRVPSARDLRHRSPEGCRWWSSASRSMPECPFCFQKLSPSKVSGLPRLMTLPARPSMSSGSMLLHRRQESIDTRQGGLSREG